MFINFLTLTYWLACQPAGHLVIPENQFEVSALVPLYSLNLSEEGQRLEVALEKAEFWLHHLILVATFLAVSLKILQKLMAMMEVILIC